MFIEPIQFGSISSTGMDEKTRRSGVEGGFQDIFKTAWDTARYTEQDMAEKQYLQSIGEIDDTHTLPIAAAKAEMSMNLLVSLRNKALEAYNELIRINV